MSTEVFIPLLLAVYAVTCAVWIHLQFPGFRTLERWLHKLSAIARLLRRGRAS